MSKVDEYFNSDKYSPSKAERQLGGYGFADEDDDRKLGWCGESLDDDEPTPIITNEYKKVVTGDEIENFVDSTGSSYYQAFLHFGVSPQDVEWKPAKTEPENRLFNEKPGPSVGLDERCIALEGLMSVFNIQNKARAIYNGGYRHMAESGLYSQDKLDDISLGVDKKSEIATRQIPSNIEMLVGSKALRESGIGEDIIAQEEKRMENNLQNEFGPGNALYKDRQKMLKKIHPGYHKSKHSA